jgi:hypothetical protein
VLTIPTQTTKPAAIMRLLHYPSQEPAPTSPSGPYDDDDEIEEEDEKVIGIGAHTEYVIFFES